MYAALPWTVAMHAAITNCFPLSAELGEWPSPNSVARSSLLDKGYLIAILAIGATVAMSGTFS